MFELLLVPVIEIALEEALLIVELIRAMPAVGLPAELFCDSPEVPFKVMVPLVVLTAVLLRLIPWFWLPCVVVPLPVPLSVMLPLVVVIGSPVFELTVKPENVGT